jgi:hypothetical protein
MADHDWEHMKEEAGKWIREIADWGSKASQEVTRAVKKGGIEASEKAQRQVELFNVQMQRRQIIRNLGEKTYRLVKSKKISNPGLTDIVDQLRKIDRKISSLKRPAK